MKILSISLPALLACLLLVSCEKSRDGTPVAPGTTTPDGSNTAGSGVPTEPHTPPSNRSGYKGTGAGVDAPDDPKAPNPQGPPIPPQPQQPAPQP